MFIDELFNIILLELNQYYIHREETMCQSNTIINEIHNFIALLIQMGYDDRDTILVN